jgi:hypothetical protein
MLQTEIVVDRFNWIGVYVILKGFLIIRNRKHETRLRKQKEQIKHETKIVKYAA